ncbi:hypothetical protein P154DRAFT_527681 [Amniculicola lignicola CBS 123094]|uniref:RelA/SpoT domain-containing protein n=1 Tax=Amniculicola lignicola CBS 123094 TaxID=1392246 RepID=A0A6A5W372_9PLEO|nr:hypothetical protein P154DRAFT_527681 [Amniculicola lignicola CBS 123094]
MDNELDLVEPTMGPRKKAITWLIETPPKIREFAYQYYASEHYNALAKQAQTLIEEELKNLTDEKGDKVQAKVTCRAKKRDSLEEKLKMREIERGKKYESYEEIQKDVKDLAGVRIILYTPTQAQHDSVKKMVLGIWGSDYVEQIKHDGKSSSKGSKETHFDAQKKKGYVRKNLGYQAYHYRALMKKSHEKEGIYDHQQHDWVEIQVVSALGHAWAEAGHDVLYKSYAYGPPSEREERILDALSGLVSTGDLLLEEFRGLVNERTNRRWSSLEEFAIFLRRTDVLENEYEEAGYDTLGEGYRPDFSPDTANIVYCFLEIIDMHYPLAVRNTLQADLGYNHNPIKRLEEVATFNPNLKPPPGFLAPLCLILKMLSKYDEKNDNNRAISTTIRNDYSAHEKCVKMMEALMLLQMFAGGAAQAKNLLHNISLETPYRDSLNFVLQSPHRFDGTDPKFVEEGLQPAWEWFGNQVHDPASLCGLFFRLTIMGVSTGSGEFKLLRNLKIGSLSRPGTLED